MHSNNPFLQAFRIFTGQGAPVSTRPALTPAMHRDQQQRRDQHQNHRPQPAKMHSSRRHEVALVGFGKRAFPISLWAGPHDPLLAKRVMGLPQRKCYERTTNIPGAMRMGLEMLQKRPWADRTMIIITDGQSNEEAHNLPGVIEAARLAGVTVHSVAMGRGFDGRQLGSICHPTGGKVILVSDLRNLSSALTDMGRTVVNQASGRPSALVVLIDFSSSMDEDAGGMSKLAHTAEATGQLLNWFIANHS